MEQRVQDPRVPCIALLLAWLQSVSGDRGLFGQLLLHLNDLGGSCGFGMERLVEHAQDARNSLVLAFSLGFAITDPDPHKQSNERSKRQHDYDLVLAHGTTLQRPRPLGPLLLHSLSETLHRRRRPQV